MWSTSIAFGASGATSFLLNSEAETGMPFVLFISAVMAWPPLQHSSALFPLPAPDSPAPRPSSPVQTRPWDCPAGLSTQPSECPACGVPHLAAWQNPLLLLYKKLFPEPPCLRAAEPAVCPR